MRQTGAEKGLAQVGMTTMVVFIMAIVGFGGWYVWQKNRDDKKVNNGGENSQSNGTEPSVDETKDWTLVTSQAGGFSMKMPDGWEVTKYPADFLGATEVSYAPGVRAVVETSSTEYSGHSLSFRASISELDDAGLGPQWSSPQSGLEESTETFSIGDLHGKRYKGVFTQDLNQTLYEYVFDLGGGKKLDILYTVDHGSNDKDEVVTVEKAIRTIKVSP